MSLSGALSNALSGLTAASRSAQVTASNLSNIMTPGYGRRGLELGSRALGGYGGVTVNGVIRHVSPSLISERRIAASSQSGSNTLASYHNRLESLVGTPANGDSLSSRLADFETSLIAAASRPDLDQRLNQVRLEAQSLTSTFERISDGIQAMRGDADREISTTVDRLNSALVQVRDLNIQISSAFVNGRDTSALEDQRQLLVDEISEIVPIKSVPRDLDAVALFTPGGAILLDGSAAEVEFSAANVIVPHMTQSGGHLSGLTINGVAISTDAETGQMRGGRLAALFEVRDVLAPEAQAQLDAVARDLVERFQDSGLDITRLPGDPGLFTDNGAAFLAADEIGLSGRLRINASVDPAQGGATWRIRDGLCAVSAGPVGNASLLLDLQAVLVSQRVPASGSFGTSAHSASGIQASFLAGIGSDRHVADQTLAFASARFSELETQLLAEGVDSDEEMQRLMLIEQAYAANARMIQTVDEMMQALMRI